MLVADLLTFFGRLHPLVVHLPIGALLLALLLDLSGYRFGNNQLRSAVRLSLLIGSASAIVACLLGYFLSLSVAYDADAVDRHMYSGIVLAIVSGVMYFVSVPQKTLTVLLVAMAGLLAYVGHQGGSLTYGADYFSGGSRQQQNPRSKDKPVDEYDSLLSTLNPDIPDSIDMQLVETLRNKGVVVRVMLQEPVMLDVTIKPESNVYIGSVEADLRAIAPNIILFNAADNDLKDADLKFLNAFVNVEKIRLEKNPLTDQVIESLVGLKHLVAVNLYNTNVTDAGVRKLRTNHSVQRVYVWGTKAG